MTRREIAAGRPLSRVSSVSVTLLHNGCASVNVPSRHGGRPTLVVRRHARHALALHHGRAGVLHHMGVRAWEDSLRSHAGELLLPIEHGLLPGLHSTGLHSWLRCAGGGVEVGRGIAKAIVGGIHGWQGDYTDEPQRLGCCSVGGIRGREGELAGDERRFLRLTIAERLRSCCRWKMALAGRGARN